MEDNIENKLPAEDAADKSVPAENAAETPTPVSEAASEEAPTPPAETAPKEETADEPAEEPPVQPIAETEPTEPAEVAPPEPETEAAPPAKPVEPVDESERRWFVIQTFSGQEDKVKANIEREVAQMNMGHKIFRVLVPEEETLEIKGTKRIEKVRKMFPGYVFVEMVLDDEAWYTIRQTPGVARFIGSGTKPQPVLDREMQRVLKQIGVKEEKLEVAFDLGETVRIISGPFRGYTGSVNEVNAGKGKLKILVSIFGRDTPVEVNFEHAEKMS
ncbi:MAG: transcription termination/antitermination protein NusG [Candidatus Margulisiibacteriota bacterium]